MLSAFISLVKLELSGSTRNRWVLEWCENALSCFPERVLEQAVFISHSSVGIDAARSFKSMFAVYATLRGYWGAEVVHGIICIMQRNTHVVLFFVPSHEADGQTRGQHTPSRITSLLTLHSDLTRSFQICMKCFTLFLSDGGFTRKIPLSCRSQHLTIVCNSAVQLLLSISGF